MSKSVQPIVIVGMAIGIQWICHSALVADHPSLESTSLIAHDMGEPCLLGSRMPFTFEYCNAADAARRIELDIYELPSVELSVFNEDGNTVPPWTEFAQTGIHVDWARPALALTTGYLLEPGECVEFCYDLNRLFQIDAPGTYRVKVRYARGEEVETTFDVAKITDQRRIAVEAHCDRPRPPTRLEGGSVDVRCDLELLHASSKNVRRLCFARVRNIRMGLDQEPHHQQITLRLPVSARIVQQELDAKMQLWTLFAAHGKQCLVVWDLLRGTTRLAIPWGDHVIEMGTTPSRYNVNKRIVIAGIKGETRISSLSEAMRSIAPKDASFESVSNAD